MTYNVLMGRLNPTHSLTLASGHASETIAVSRTYGLTAFWVGDEQPPPPYWVPVSNMDLFALFTAIGLSL